MRTTIDLPDDLLRRAKARAALDGLTLKKLLTRFVEQGLQRSNPDFIDPKPRKRSQIPVIKHLSNQPVPSLTNAELFDLMDREELDREMRIRGSS